MKGPISKKKLRRSSDKKSEVAVKSSTNLAQKKESKTKKRKVDDYEDIVDEDDMEIARLEKLLGIDSKKDRKKSAMKLNKEYEANEGITGSFGDFLLDLDRISSSFKEPSKNLSRSDDNDDFDGEDDSQQDLADDDDGDNAAISDMEGMDEDGDSQMDDKEASDGEMEHNSKYYVPAPGEDIYGRVVDSALASKSTEKYVPPARRAMDITINKDSEVVMLLQRQINGLFNRLSDQSKDGILTSIQKIYSSNSVNITNQFIKDNILTSCCKDSQLCVTLIPLYAALIAALHYSVSIDVGAYLVEVIASALAAIIDELKELLKRNTTGNASISQKTHLASNQLLILVYLYNFRILHHNLINDIIAKLVGNDISEMSESDIELLLLTIDHGGFQLRIDDPINMKNIIAKLFSRKRDLASHNDSDVVSGRYQYMLDVLTDLKNNKSRRVQNLHIETVKSYRKWIGSVKSRHQESSADRTLRVSLHDLLIAETKGRWWKAGASWKGNELHDKQPKQSTSSTTASLSIIEEGKLNSLAQKLRLTTENRKNILYAMMNSRDVHDAYESISKINLKGRQDRDIIRVLMECAANEKIYNRFYGELACMLCSENRQFKTTLQFLYWDAFKLMIEDDASPKNQRRYMNLADLLIHLVNAFHVPLAVLRPIDMSSTLNSISQQFLGKFFTELFTNKVTDETFQAIFDRIATSSDYDQTRDTILLYLQTHFTSSHGYATQDVSRARRKQAISTLQSMKVLDFSKKSDKGNSSAMLAD